MQWITRERPKIDRVACPWLIRRFVDPHAEFLFVAPPEVRTLAARTGAIPYDVERVELTHDGPLCSFDAIMRKYRLNDPALAEMATIIRGADTDRHDLHAACPGVYAVLIGLSATYSDDHEQLEHGMVVCEALYAWCARARSERHDWNPQKVARAGGA
jgi:hypothetical protein